MGNCLFALVSLLALEGCLFEAWLLVEGGEATAIDAIIRFEI